jgi:hypothetical protein
VKQLVGAKAVKKLEMDTLLLPILQLTSLVCSATITLQDILGE